MVGKKLKIRIKKHTPNVTDSTSSHTSVTDRGLAATSETLKKAPARPVVRKLVFKVRKNGDLSLKRVGSYKTLERSISSGSTSSVSSTSSKKRTQNSRTVDTGSVSSDNVVSEPRVAPLQPVKLGKKEQRTINKKLASALIRGRGDDIVELVTKGGAIAYQNYDAINEAAERGKLKTFQAIFERLSYRQLVDKDLIRDLMEASDEEGHQELHRYLSNYAGNCLEKIEGENMAGFDDED